MACVMGHWLPAPILKGIQTLKVSPFLQAIRLRGLPALLICLAILAGVGCAGETETAPGGDPKIVQSTAPFEPDSGSMVVQCGALIDGLSDTAGRNVAVTIRQGRIAAVGALETMPSDLPRLDLADYTCLPGLIDMHTHIMEGPEDLQDLTRIYNRTVQEQLAMGREFAHQTLLAGVTSARSTGTYIFSVSRNLRDEINQGRTVGPRLQVADFYLTIPGGGGDIVVPGIPESEIPAHLRTGVARGADEFRRKAEFAVSIGADFLKVIASGAVLSYGGVPGEPEMTPEEIAAVVEVARTAGLRVAAHAHSAQSIREAILAGVDTIEHATYIDAEGIGLAIEHEVGLVMDVYNGDYAAELGKSLGWPKEFLRKMAETTDIQRVNFTQAHAAGATIVFGSDAGVYPHGIAPIQFPIMVREGMTPMEVIQSATSVAAEYLGWSDRVGAIAPGLFGDLIAVPGDPLEDITILQDVPVVIQGGLAFKLPTE
jgi:imidazolonepropionase-like amidohydrolase